MSKTKTTKSTYELRYERMKKYIRELGANGNIDARNLYLAIWNDEYMDYAIRPYSLPFGWPSWSSKLFYRLRTNRVFRAWKISRYV